LLEDRGKPRKPVSRWPVAGPSGCILTTSQQSGKQKLKKIPCLKSQLVKKVLKNSARTSKRTPHFTIATINLLTLFNKIIPVYSETHTKHKHKMLRHWWVK
jgi:hypothetical protein